MAADATHFCEAFFRELAGRGIPFVILHGYERMPEMMPSDIDYAVRNEDLPRLLAVQREIAARLGWVLASAVQAKLYALYTVFFDPQNPSLFIQLDACSHYVERGCLVLHDTDMLASRQPHRFLSIPAPGVEFAYTLAKVLIKSQPLEKYLPGLQQLWEADPIGAGTFFTKLTGEPPAALKDWFARPATDWVQQLRPRLRSRTRLGPADLLRECGRALRRIGRPLGLHIVFMGSDGSGKSTLITRLGALDCFRRQRLFHFRPSLFEKTQGTPVTQPHAQKPRSPLFSLLKTFYYFADHLVGYWLRVFPARIQNELVIFDRSFEDLLIDPRRYRMAHTSGLARLLSKMLPRPDLTFVLDADPVLIHSRKPELPLDELSKQRERLQQLAITTPRCSIISAERPAEDVEQEVRRFIIQFLAEREERNHPSAPARKS